MISRGVKVYQYGNTIRFKCVFHDFNNTKINPDTVKIIVYNYKYEVIFESIVENIGEIGEYMFDYTTANKKQRLYYEWNGEIDGRASLKRGEFTTDFI